MEQELRKHFEELYGAGGEIISCFAPGRVNLIGEHTDYNGGHVFPCALTIGTYGIARKREDRQIRFYSENFKGKGVVETSLEDLVPSDAAGWTNYPKGVVWALEKKGYSFSQGFDMLIYGDIPNGSGLSSSASLEVLTGLILKELYGLDDLTMTQIALNGQYSENNFNGCNCGIMDQFASAMGKKDCAIFLDTNTLNYEYAPVKLDAARIVITNSKVKHSLVGSAYNDRRNECETALKELQKVCEIGSLGELDEELEAQYQCFVTLVGRGPTHIDSHLYAHQKFSKVRDSLLRLAENHGVPVRQFACGMYPPIYFEGNFKVLPGEGRDGLMQKFTSLVGALPKKAIAELMVHPAFADEVLLQSSSYNLQRVQEHSVLTDTYAAQFLRAQGIELVSFKECKG